MSYISEFGQVMALQRSAAAPRVHRGVALRELFAKKKRKRRKKKKKKRRARLALARRSTPPAYRAPSGGRGRFQREPMKAKLKLGRGSTPPAYRAPSGGRGRVDPEPLPAFAETTPAVTSPVAPPPSPTAPPAAPRPPSGGGGGFTGGGGGAGYRPPSAKAPLLETELEPVVFDTDLVVDEEKPFPWLWVGAGGLLLWAVLR